jgi:hypothetical protein
MVDRYAKFATEHLAAAAARIERGRDANVISFVTFCHGPVKQTDTAECYALFFW